MHFFVFGLIFDVTTERFDSLKHQHDQENLLQWNSQKTFEFFEENFLLSSSTLSLSGI